MNLKHRNAKQKIVVYILVILLCIGLLLPSFLSIF